MIKSIFLLLFSVLFPAEEIPQNTEITLECLLEEFKEPNKLIKFAINVRRNFIEKNLENTSKEFIQNNIMNKWNTLTEILKKK